MNWTNFILATVFVPIIAFVVSTWVPGIMRKIQARIQQRIGPPVLMPGFWAVLKFFYKKRIKPVSPLPRLYHSIPVIGIFLMFFIILLTNPEWRDILGLATLVALAGLIKVEEALYVIMGNLSNNIMSVRMPYPDLVSGATMKTRIRRNYEKIGVTRAFKLITVGSFPLYLGMFVPAVIVGSIGVMSIAGYQGFDMGSFTLSSIFDMRPLLFTLPGVVGAIAYFAGYLVIINEYPFSIMHTKADVIEGPTMEYAAAARAGYYLMREMTMFVMSSVFVTLYFGIPPALNWAMIPHIILAMILPVIAAIVSAFTPVLTFRQIYPLSLGFSAIGVIGVIVAIL
ncbi:MAG TPA: NADH-quinone oxidoreductase subunit H [Candidatus Methanofastidiosa archaeon]|nr:NADH-quinone oxidoreductase subunit H [Candidatus Methanofastidiosa archaeon]